GCRGPVTAAPDPIAPAATATPATDLPAPSGKRVPAQRRPYCWHNNGILNRIGKTNGIKVKNPLTMIKGTLPIRFSSICQSDRMRNRSAT
ncbi:MAG: hypothetical protein WA177_06010, partial [Xanthobacteraceae bacterium]